MQIYTKPSGPEGLETIHAAQGSDVAEHRGLRMVPPVESSADRSDRVVVRDAGRALAARVGIADVSSMDPVRAEHIRDRVLSGAYDTLEVVDAVARRLLDSGDI